MPADPKLRRLSINTATLGFQWEFGRAMDAVARAGIGGVAPWRRDLAALPPAAAGRRARDAGLAVTSLCRASYLTHAEPAGRRAALDDNRRAVDEAHELGAPVLCCVVGGLPAGSRDLASARSQVVDGLAALAEHARGSGVRLAVEPLNRYETSLLNTIGQTLEAIDPLPAATCGVLADVYHQNIEERDPAAAIRACGERLAHVHVCANDRGAPGADHLDWPALVDAIGATGYRGPLVIESFTAEQETIATAASVWRPFAASPDALAVDGLAFLRTL